MLGKDSRHAFVWLRCYAIRMVVDFIGYNSSLVTNFDLVFLLNVSKKGPLDLTPVFKEANVISWTELFFVRVI